MKVSKISSELKYVEINGCTLSIEERCRLELGCEELRRNIECEDSALYFWGKIRGKFIKVNRV